jgi:hypothetical protein
VSGTATRTVTLANMTNQNYPITASNLPAGISATDYVAGSGNTGTITLSGNTITSVAGTYPNCTVTFGGVTSAPFSITIENSTLVSTFSALKTALETSGTSTVVVTGNIIQALSGLTYSQGEDLIRVVGTKTLVLNSNVNITNDNNNANAPRCLISVISGVTLHVQGVGSMGCDFNANNYECAVIFNQAGILTVQDVTLNGRAPFNNVKGLAIYTGAGSTTTIHSGTFTGVGNAGSSLGDAVYVVDGMVTINGGTFSASSQTSNTNLAGLFIYRTATVSLNGGAYSQGIDGDNRNISTFLGSSRNMYNAASGGSIVPANVTRVTTAVWVR